MSVQFAANISALRREKNITQKAAAEELGISQALLSHYEKGIRECNLDFVIKAAEYYGVTTDYLLGVSDSKHGSNEIFESTPMKSDNQLISKTVLRSFLQLLEMSEENGEEFILYFNNYFSLSEKKFITSICTENNNLEKLCDIASDSSDAPKNESFLLTSEEGTPLCIKTINAHAEKIIKSKISEILKQEN